jgi:xanthine dehydrogenase accessory factor
MVEAVLEVLAGPERGALATVVRVSGSTPQRPGARLLLRADGSTLGTVGGGALEGRVLEALTRVRDSGRSEFVSSSLGHDLGMCCGGRMEVFVEALEAAPRLWIFGAGHVAKPLALFTRTMGFEVRVVDDREELNTAERFPECELTLLDPVELLKREKFGRLDWLVIVTHDHTLDERALEVAMSTEARYIGLVGSRRKVFRLVQRIAGRGGKLDLDRVYGPVGLDLGALGPEEIALSIAAELVALRRGKPAPHLRALSDVRLGEPVAD